MDFLAKCNKPDENQDLFMKDTLVFNNPNAAQLMTEESKKYWLEGDRHKQFFAFMCGCKHELGVGGNKWNCGTDTGSRYCDTNCYGEWARLWFYSREYEGEFFDKIKLENEESDLLTGRKYIIMIDPLNSALGWERMRKIDKENNEVKELDEKTTIASSN